MRSSLEHDLAAALHDTASGVRIPQDAWEENRRRVGSDRTLRHPALAVAAAAASAACVAALAVGPSLLSRPVNDANDSLRLGPMGTASGPALPAPQDGRVATERPVVLGTVTVQGKERQVVLLLRSAVAGGSRDEIMDAAQVCTALADPDGPVLRVGSCYSLGGVPGDALLANVVPGEGLGLPAPECAFGPLGNLTVLLARDDVDRADLLSTDAPAVPMEVVPSAADWPVRVFTGEVPRGTYLAGFRMTAGHQVVRDDSKVAGRGQRGCPATR